MTDTDQHIGLEGDDPLFGGDTVRIDVTVTDASGNPLDLSTATSVTFEVFDDAFYETATLSYSDGDSALTIGGTDSNVATVELSSTDTEDLAPGRGASTYVYRLRVVDSNGDSDTVTTGRLKVQAA